MQRSLDRGDQRRPWGRGVSSHPPQQPAWLPLESAVTGEAGPWQVCVVQGSTLSSGFSLCTQGFSSLL